jgi:Mce-associated membrane protein
MSGVPQGPGWWQASDLKWYPPEHHADNIAPLWPPPPPPGGRRPRGLLKWLLIAAVVVIVAAAAGIGGYLLRQTPTTSQPSSTTQPVPPVADQTAQREAVIDAAEAAASKILSYNFATIEQDTDAAAKLLTGQFLTYYTQFVQQVVIPAAKEKQVTTTATVVRAAVESLTSDQAFVLVVVNQSSTSAAGPLPKIPDSSVNMGMAKVNGTWLVDSFDPV